MKQIKQMKKIQIQDPSGETRILEVDSDAWIGRGDEASIPLRDPTAPLLAAFLRITPDGKAWMQTPDDSPGVEISDLKIKSAELPDGIPFKIGETRLCILRESREVRLPDQPKGAVHWLTTSESGKDILWTIRKTAATSLSIYLAGETGTGKEVLAHLIHAWSERATGPFVPLHCGALPLSLAESELFGHSKGAFTGAHKQRPGALLQAHGGTLFLDEVGDLSPEIQVKLLRFLENGEIRPVGADQSVHADVRLVCATHHPLERLVEEGRFRRDLYYRLASITVNIPTLRDRPEDIRLLAKKFAKDFKRTLSSKALLRLQAHSWPGNVRELRHTIERACGMAGPFQNELSEDAFSFLLTPSNVTKTPQMELGTPSLTLKEMERVMILKALKISRGNRNEAARILGIARSTLFEMLKRHRIQGPRSPLSRSSSIEMIA